MTTGEKTRDSTAVRLEDKDIGVGFLEIGEMFNPSQLWPHHKENSTYSLDVCIRQGIPSQKGTTWRAEHSSVDIS